MPNTKSAERRMRGNARKRAQNRSAKSRLGTIEKNYLAIVAKGDKAAASTAFRDLSSALDKAAKSGIVHRATANRKKSRLCVRLNALK
jgi:small subunit ribosomal protein S20